MNLRQSESEHFLHSPLGPPFPSLKIIQPYALQSLGNGHGMTINSVRYLDPANSSNTGIDKHEPKPPAQIWHAVEPPFKGYQPPPMEGYYQSSSESAIVIDNGSFEPTIKPSWGKF